MEALALVNPNLVSDDDVKMLPDVEISGTPIKCARIEIDKPTFNSQKKRK
ncbi:hypothetical protein M4L39_11005 [Staphylococcus equorum]|uniref:Uncharacterized protein n=1 Tax=Staphylococcus equorum TaxID=246432 RepID=A0A9X4LBW0_9STAP|nr:hypothetical protein [Staphylococcus equorum]MDG0843977.1 hypothetical protein [Staphylococcus equorum]MDG0860268.1 hypothetical protein [Staphylococcus equorum]